uniref:Uncharacterized protein n=1 Tax=Avena sativa TaxID=4498 RepID=A0ACD5YNN4_AVESA
MQRDPSHPRAQTPINLFLKKKRRAAMAKRLIPSLNRVLVEKLVQPNKTAAGILLPETTKQLNSAKVIAVGPGGRDRDGKLVPVSLKEGDTVLLPEYGGTEVKLAEKEYLLFGEHDILGRLEE